MCVCPRYRPQKPFTNVSEASMYISYWTSMSRLGIQEAGKIGFQRHRMTKVCFSTVFLFRVVFSGEVLLIECLPVDRFVVRRLPDKCFLTSGSAI